MIDARILRRKAVTEKTFLRIEVDYRILVPSCVFREGIAVSWSRLPSSNVSIAEHGEFWCFAANLTAFLCCLAIRFMAALWISVVKRLPLCFTLAGTDKTTLVAF